VNQILVANGDNLVGEPKCWSTVGIAELVCKENYSQEAVEKVRKWVHECKTEHGCEDYNATKPYIPHMVIDVSGEKPRLVIRPKYSPYVALSYCWGKGVHESSKTISSNVLNHLVSIEDSSLPATIRQSMSLTAKLGYRYIWIDSLCIMQDDTAAWLRESKEMASIYGHADLVIIADLALDCTSDLYLKNQAYSLVNHQRTVKLKYGWKGCEKVVIRKPYWKMHDPTQFLNCLPGPTSTRAWTWQELFLSQRRLILSPFEMRFGCEETTNCECAGLWQQDSEKGVDPWVTLVNESKANYRGHDTSLDSESAADLYSLWLNWMSDYSRRNITKATDRLVAISAVAQVIQSAISKATGHEETYAAGHFVGDLARSLLWAARDEPADNPVLSTDWVQKANQGTVPFAERKEGAYWSEYLPQNVMPKLQSWVQGMFGYEPESTVSFSPIFSL
jgi:Heterokaryon incompatibility protein (HET)